MALSFDQMRWAILGLVIDRGHVSFAEITRFIDLDGGDCAIAVSSDLPNTFMWTNMSENAVLAVQSLIKEKKVFVHPMAELSYFADGMGLNLPIAKSARAYKEPHWFPACLHHKEFKG